MKGSKQTNNAVDSFKRDLNMYFEKPPVSLGSNLVLMVLHVLW